MSDHHILVIDDDERLRLLLRRFLEESGFRVTDVGSTAEARGILAGLAFDLLIIDIMMPGETGVEFLQELRKSNPVPALFLTALSETEHRPRSSPSLSVHTPRGISISGRRKQVFLRQPTLRQEWS